jgi:ER degradation enhancer, mannosidase alpha-like 1
MLKGHVASSNIDSLSAFWAGLQVLAGDVQGAIKSHLFCKSLLRNSVRLLVDWRADWNLWRKFHAIPELVDAATNMAVVTTYPLRPGLT